MLDTLKRHWVLFCGVLIILAICIQGIANQYVNGQAIASAHTDGHSAMPLVSVFFAVALTYIGSLFYCCPPGGGDFPLPSMQSTLAIIFYVVVVTIVSIGAFFYFSWQGKEQD